MPQSKAPRPSPFVPERSPLPDPVRRCLNALDALTCPTHQRTTKTISYLRDCGWLQVQWGVGFGWRTEGTGTMTERDALNHQVQIDLRNLEPTP
jgi:hypothetical protein